MNHPQNQQRLIFYWTLDDGVEILRVISSRRDFPTLFKKSN
jgi:plasmid stabilization system protein ParE